MSVKDSVLKVLSESKSSDGFVSGQELAEKCGVTRTSVWKAVEALRKQGAGIEAVTNRGYRLTGDGIFSEEKITKILDDLLDVTAENSVVEDTVDEHKNVN